MPSKKVEIMCPICKGLFLRNPHDVIQSQKRSGSWKCWLCSRKTRKQKTEKPIGHKRLLKHRQRIQIKTEIGWVDEHRYVMEKYLGRKLEVDEVVHHIDGNYLNNNIDNLELMLHGKHTAFHHAGIKASNETRKKLSEKAKARPLRPQKLSSNIVKDIIYKHKNNKYSYRELASLYNVSYGMIGHIINKRSWSKSI